MDKEDIEDKALANLSCKVNNIEIKPKSLNEIVKYGQKNFYNCLNILLLDKNDILQNFDLQRCNEVERNLFMNMTSFDLLVLQCAQSKKFFNLFQNALLYFLGEKEDKIGFLFSGRIQDIKKAVFYINDLKDNKLINESNFEDIRTILKIQNVIVEKKKEKLNPFNSVANELIKLRDKMRKTVQKSKENSGLQLRDIISIVASNNDIGLNIVSVYDINMYILQDQLQRIAVNENYSMQKYLLGNSFGGGSIDFKNNTYLKKL
ncbi:hypothetical protein ACFHWD_04080 [Clostridium sp. MT-14]|uniref:hypothetical protein n=1 Tax=Clostridium sp. MT-14 TaxID=3348360 RepID=UPI0035F3BB04